MSNVTWLIETCLMDNEQKSRLYKALSKNVFHESEWRPFIDEADFHGLTSYDPVAVYGSIQFARKASQFSGNLLIEPDYLVTNYRESLGIPDELWLNDGMFTTWGRLKRDVYSILPGNSSIFVRPNSGSKTFTGFAIHKQKFNEKANGVMLPWSEIDNNTLVQVSPAQRIYSEYRMFIYDKNVITGSLYGDGTTSNTINPVAQELAENIAAINKWEVPFVVDIAVLPDRTAKIIEVNCITCTGWYDADYSAIVECINDYTVKAWKELNA